MMNKSVAVENDKNEKMYLCTWNGGDIVEIHTEKTLRKEYKDTNLFDVDDDELVNNSMFNWCTVIPPKAYDKAKSMDDVFIKFNDEDMDFVGYMWEKDNMQIQRIK
jgi:hypothetical protein